jgi:transposase InsO family protein
VIIERLTSYTYIILYKEASDIEELAYIFQRNIMSHHSLPREIISDRDKLFISQFWQSLMDQMGTKHKLSTSYHPQIDEKTERTNQTIKQYLRCYVNRE